MTSRPRSSRSNSGSPRAACATVTLDISTDLALPLDPSQGITLKGRVLVANEEIGLIECKISGSEVSGRLMIPVPIRLRARQNTHGRLPIQARQRRPLGRWVAKIYSVIDLNLNLLLRFLGEGDGSFDVLSTAETRRDQWCLDRLREILPRFQGDRDGHHDLRGGRSQAVPCRARPRFEVSSEWGKPEPEITVIARARAR